MSRPLTHKARFGKYRDEGVIHKCKQYAQWTLPQLMADPQLMGPGHNVVLERDYQEVGPLLVNNLAAKLTALLFPAARPFFEVSASAEVLKRAASRNVDEQRFQSEMSKLVLKACQRLFKNASYAQQVQATRHLVVTGNVCTYRDSQLQRNTTYGLQNFAVRRDGRGILLDNVIREFTFFEALDPTIQKALRIAYPNKYRRLDDAPPVELYTRIERKQGKAGRVYFEVTQEADDIPVGTPGQYPEHLCPWQVITWNLIAGENYGRGLVEDYAGGFAKLSDGSEAAALYAIEMMRVLNLVAPGTGADIDEIATSESGEWVQGVNGSVSAHETGDARKLQAVRAELSEVFGNLARAFMWKANTRDAERVTAYELRLDAQEADNVLGGTYSSLAETWQVPLAHILLHEERPDILKNILTDDIRLDIIAGVPALGRSLELQNLLDAAADLSAIMPVFTQLNPRVNAGRLFELIANLSSIDTEKIYNTEAEQKQLDQAQAIEQQGMTDLAQAEAGAATAGALQAL